MTKSKAPKKRIYSKPGQNDIELDPNQAAITIHKTAKDSKYSEEGIQFCIFANNCWGYASRTLKRKPSLQLYTYLLMNKDGFHGYFSPQDICNFTGMNKKSFYNARDELEVEGFLYCQKKDGKTLFYDVWNFYESPWDNPNWEHYDELHEEV